MRTVELEGKLDERLEFSSNGDWLDAYVGGAHDSSLGELYVDISENTHTAPLDTLGSPAVAP
jgi:hypothetical protein